VNTKVPPSLENAGMSHAAAPSTSVVEPEVRSSRRSVESATYAKCVESGDHVTRPLSAFVVTRVTAFVERFTSQMSSSTTAATRDPSGA
jgi:hypothetical protein